MHDDGLDIPDFLRRQPGDEPATVLPTNKKPRKGKGKRHPFHLPKTMEPEAWALLRQIEKEKAEKQKARFEMLRQLKTRKR
jgi:hypothetical protein